MIYTAFADYRRLSFDEVKKRSLYASLPENIKERIEKTGSEEVKVSRLGGYLLLYHTVRFLFGQESFEIRFLDNGKPYFNKGDITFNISHSAGMCAVAVCEGGLEIGVDIQEKIDRERAARLKERFMNYSLGGLTPTEPIIYLFGAFSCDGNCMFADIPNRSLALGNIKEDATDLWSLTEAILKCDGGGFCKAQQIMNNKENFCSETVRFNYKGSTYSVSTVTGK